MIDFDPGDELTLVADTARQFARDVLEPARRSAEKARAVAPDARAAAAEIGLAGLEWPEAHGGAGQGPLARVLVNEELAAADAGAALALDPYGPGLYPLLECDEVALERLSAALEPTGARAVLACSADATIAWHGDRVRVDLPWAPADRVDALVVLDGDAIALVTEGIETTTLPGAGLRAAGACALHADAVPAARARNADAAARALARARLYAASLLLGVLRHACDFSRGYALERHAFGRPIAHHQALAFLIADMQMAVDTARALVHDAAWRAETGRPCAAAAAQSFAHCIEAQRLVGPAGVQILGGHGFMADYPMEKAMRESRALASWLGGFDAAVEDAGRAVCDGDPVVAVGIELA